MLLTVTVRLGLGGSVGACDFGTVCKISGSRIATLAFHKVLYAKSPSVRGPKAFWIGDEGRVPAGSGTFTAAHGEYQTSAPAPNDKGIYHFVDSQTVVCANAAGQQLTWRRQTAPRAGRIDANTAAKEVINYSPPTQRPGVIKK